MVNLTEDELIEENDLHRNEEGDGLNPKELSRVNIAFQDFRLGLVNKNSLDMIYGFYNHKAERHENKTWELRFYPSHNFFRSFDVDELPVYLIRLRRLFYK